MKRNYFQIELEIRDRTKAYFDTWTCNCGCEEHIIFRREDRYTIFERTFFACVNCGKIHSEKVFSEQDNKKRFMEFRIYDKKVSKDKLAKLKKEFNKELKRLEKK